MTDNQLKRALQSVGMAAFVTHLRLFQSSMPNESIAAALNDVTEWTPHACRTRTSHARAIIRAGRQDDALAMIAQAARVPDPIRDAARRLRAAP